ncbi:MAG: recombinase RecA [Bacillota bacterium]
MSSELQNKAKAIDNVLGQIEKQFGKGSIMRLGDKTHNMDVATFSTGSLELDIALGVGGLPKGRIIEMYGPESSGKTTLALHSIAEVQREGGVAAFVDAEHALDPKYAGNIGVDTENLIVSQPDTGEQALEIVDALVRSGAIDVIVIDSVAALVPKAEISGEMGDSHMGLQARLMSQALRKLAGISKKAGTSIIFINQIRMKIGVVFGNPETTSGGRALKFYSSVRLDIRRRKTIKENKEKIGNKTKVKVVKNKVAPPFKEAHFDIMYGKGISKESNIISAGLDADIVSRAGAWYSYGETQLGQGKENSKQFLMENEKLRDEIEYKIRKKHKLPTDHLDVSLEEETDEDEKEDEKEE